MQTHAGRTMHDIYRYFFFFVIFFLDMAISFLVRELIEFGPWFSALIGRKRFNRAPKLRR